MRFLLAATLLLAGCSAPSGGDEQPLNSSVIMADDLDYGDLSTYGGWIDTPNLDRMAADSLKFADFHSNGAVCSPTRAALVTGRYQQRAGVPVVIFAPVLRASGPVRQLELPCGREGRRSVPGAGSRGGAGSQAGSRGEPGARKASACRSCGRRRWSGRWPICTRRAGCGGCTCGAGEHSQAAAGACLWVQPGSADEVGHRDRHAPHAARAGPRTGCHPDGPRLFAVPGYLELPSGHDQGPVGPQAKKLPGNRRGTRVGHRRTTGLGRRPPSSAKPLKPQAARRISSSCLSHREEILSKPRLGGILRPESAPSVAASGCAGGSS